MSSEGCSPCSARPAPSRAPSAPRYAARLGREYRLPDLFSSGGITAAHPNLLWSLFLPFLLAAALTLLGLLTRLRTPVLLAGVLALGFAVLWAVRAAQANGDSLTLAADGSGLRLGVAGAAGGGVLLLLAAGIMAGRVRRAPGAPARPRTAPAAARLRGRPRRGRLAGARLVRPHGGERYVRVEPPRPVREPRARADHSPADHPAPGPLTGRRGGARAGPGAQPRPCADCVPVPSFASSAYTHRSPLHA
ncbi:hypothetical protein GA0115252_13883 [Streptomyces sp. DfronAA-171]|nr:hypothetical protein GA0115252_13883 [Streptomyces sp. DfronAA-171]